MNPNANGVVATMITSTTKFDYLTVAENGLVLKQGKKQLSQISFSGIDKIYIKVYKPKPIYYYLFFIIPMLFAFLCFEFVRLNVEMAMVLFPVIPPLVKTSRFNSYGLVIVTKEGSVYRKKLPLKLKTDTIEIINEVKKKMVAYRD
jgi:hypothetical protein